MTAVKTTSIAPALRSIVRIRAARKAATEAVYDRTDTICRALDAIDNGATLGEALGIAFNAGYVTGLLDGPDVTATSQEMLAAVLDPRYAEEAVR